MKLEDIATIQWFPGHMTKTLRLMESELKNVDMVIELVDARAPLASTNTRLHDTAGKKPTLLLLNKADLADESATAGWLKYFKDNGFGAVAVSSKDSKTAKTVVDAAKALVRDKTDRLKEKGFANTTVRAMVIGVPNVGKSTLINCLAGSAKTRAADKPGVTRGKQWISLKDIDLLDMAGVLPPKFEDKRASVLLAATGAIKDDVVDVVSVACFLLEFLRDRYSPRLCERYKLEQVPEDGFSALEAIARKRGMLISGGEADIERAAVMLLDEFRGGKLGRITLEEAPL